MGESVDPRIRVAVCLCRGDEILLVEHRKAERRYWLLPGGGVEKGETLVEAARREALEETGFEVSVGGLVLLCESIATGGRHVVNLIFTAALEGGELRLPDDGVISDVRWIGRDQLASLTLHPPIAAALVDCWNDGFSGQVRVLGKVWTA